MQERMQHIETLKGILKLAKGIVMLSLEMLGSQIQQTRQLQKLQASICDAPHSAMKQFKLVLAMPSHSNSRIHDSSILGIFMSGHRLISSGCACGKGVLEANVLFLHYNAEC